MLRRLGRLARSSRLAGAHTSSPASPGMLACAPLRSSAPLCLCGSAPGSRQIESSRQPAPSLGTIAPWQGGEGPSAVGSTTRGGCRRKQRLHALAGCWPPPNRAWRCVVARAAGGEDSICAPMAVCFAAGWRAFCGLLALRVGRKRSSLRRASTPTAGASPLERAVPGTARALRPGGRRTRIRPPRLPALHYCEHAPASGASPPARGSRRITPPAASMP